MPGDIRARPAAGVHSSATADGILNSRRGLDRGDTECSDLNSATSLSWGLVGYGGRERKGRQKRPPEPQPIYDFRQTFFLVWGGALIQPIRGASCGIAQGQLASGDFMLASSTLGRVCVMPAWPSILAIPKAVHPSHRHFGRWRLPRRRDAALAIPRSERPRIWHSGTFPCLKSGRSDSQTA